MGSSGLANMTGWMHQSIRQQVENLSEYTVEQAFDRAVMNDPMIDPLIQGYAFGTGYSVEQVSEGIRLNYGRLYGHNHKEG